MLRNMIKLLTMGLACLLPAAAAWADGAVYAMTNALDNNEVLVYHRAADGSLSLAQVTATGGGGSGLQLAGVDSLGSAGSIQLDPDHDLLFVVNTESAAENNGAGAYNTDCQQGTITAFRVAADGTLTFADRVFSGGLFPNSLTVKKIGKGNNDKKGELLYVLNAGGPEAPAICHLTPATANGPNITGFSVDERGHMTPVDSTQPIDPGPATGSGENCSAASAAGFSALTGAPAADFQCGLNPPSFARSPAQIAFSPDGTQLVVTIKGTNTIDVFPVDKSGSAGSPTVTQASLPALPTYFGVDFAGNGDLLAVEMFGGATSIPAGGVGAVSSFAVDTAGDLTAISAHIGDGGTAPAAVAVEPIVGRLAYVSNNLSASISSYTVGSNGVLTLLNGTAAAASGPNDLATAAEGNSSFLYVVSAGTGRVDAFRINGDGSLTAITGGGGLPAGRSAQGLAAF
ncbi:MAG TPA: beta-propeller fold lactonase family protein [Stellaceae bacterium]